MYVIPAHLFHTAPPGECLRNALYMFHMFRGLRNVKREAVGNFAVGMV